MTFSTSLKPLADFVQFAFTSCGYSVSINTYDRRGRIRTVNGKSYETKSVEYGLAISERKLSGIAGDNKVKINSYKPVDGFKYCFTVPSHMWIMRRGDRIVVTGNCGKSTLLTQSCVLEAIDRGESVFWFNAESTPSQMLNWI